MRGLLNVLLSPSKLLPVLLGLAIPVFWYCIASLLIPQAPVTFALCMASAIAAGIVAALVEIQARVAGIARNQTAIKIAKTLGIFIPIVCILVGLSISVGSWQQLFASDPKKAPEEQQVSGAKLPAMNQAQKDAIKDIFLRFPLQSVDPWRLSPLEANLAFDRSRQDMQYVMNLTYLSQLHYHITYGRTDPATVQYRAGEGPQWIYLRPREEKISLNDAANYLHIKALPPWKRGSRDTPDIGVYFVAEPPSDAVVIRTQKVIKGGKNVLWGPVWTILGDRPLKIEMKIIILDPYGNPFPANHFTETLPYVGLVDDSEYSKTDPANAVYCSGTFTEFTDKSPRLANGKQLVISIPDDFGDALVLVNLRIR
ncbi:MAG: hypothetical protein WD972_03390 [Candidatus Andersenbacteria bacterium]